VLSLTLLTWKVKNRVPVIMFENAVLSITRPLQQAATWTTQSLSGTTNDCGKRPNGYDRKTIGISKPICSINACSGC
jgi:hypothetical protein